MSLTSTCAKPPPKKSLIVGVAEMVVSNDPNTDLVTYSLGSCIGVAVYDPIKQIGGLLHVMLPDSNLHPAKAALWPSMFVDTGVSRLFHDLYNLGADRDSLVIKAAGGAQFFDTAGVFNIGERNQQALLELLTRNGFSLQASDLGGIASRTLRLELGTGRVQIQTPGVNIYSL
jgi:chemotaxis protein CheD